ncbi:alpha-2-macroglobulin receptor-associated protein [Brevipalpus obovatus]|uniref:alpha-2-macroglobulin receptor-associated protein n=1 Tax=Brevipalpus obovatus TaxID=246614 RepID=UPI003D9E1E0E
MLKLWYVLVCLSVAMIGVIGDTFKDKKIEKLWQKALKAGFNDEQLQILKEEFMSHQDKFDDYHRLIREFENMENSIHIDEEEKTMRMKNKEQFLQDKHIQVKKSYDTLKSKVREASVKTGDGDFDEPRVQKLWDLAKKSNFAPDELASLKEELTHYQTRVRKLKYFEDQLENDIHLGKNKPKPGKEETHLEHKVKELVHKVDKLHNHLETKIMRRHIEL